MFYTDDKRIEDRDLFKDNYTNYAISRMAKKLDPTGKGVSESMLSLIKNNKREPKKALYIKIRGAITEIKYGT